MNALLYGVVPALCVELPAIGVRGAPVLSEHRNQICVVYSPTIEPHRFDSEDILSFHNVLGEVLTRSDLVPFRFPTVIPLDEVGQVLDRDANHYSAALTAIAGRVQMDLEVPRVETAPETTSGITYLRSKAAVSRRSNELLASAREVLAPFVSSMTASPKPGRLIIHALVQRNQRIEFISHARRAFPKARITGPWPPSAFIER